MFGHLRYCRAGHVRCALVVATICLSLCSGTVAQTRESGTQGPSIPRTFKSQSILLHTDLSAEQSQELLQRLETMLGFVSRYWGRPLRGVITMYVARNIEDWPPEVIAQMHPTGVASIRSGGGLTIGIVSVRGKEFRSRAVVYADADHGTPQHEAVHAYCNHAFGGTGPVWYAEGMAEVGHYWVEGDKGVSAPPRVIAYLRRSPPKHLDAIINNPLETSGDSWQNYAWRWALCHLLGHNENYSQRFKPLGLQLLNRKDIDFWQVYGSQAQEIDFEYRQFLKTMASGYRVDLCSWDWKTRFSAPTGGRSITSKIRADRGWQASRVLVSEGAEYEYAAAGTWSLATGTDNLTADGGADGRGRLMGVILTEYELGEPFELGAFGSFKAATGGKLYLRCRDDWGAIADNAGSVTVRIKEQGSGRPLVDPGAEDADVSPTDEAIP